MSGIMAANYARLHALKHSIVKRKQGENKNRIHLLPLYCFRKPYRLCPRKWHALERAPTIILWHAKMSKRRTLIACEISTVLHTSLYSTEPTKRNTKPPRNYLFICSICCVPIRIPKLTTFCTGKFLVAPHSNKIFAKTRFLIRMRGSVIARLLPTSQSTRKIVSESKHFLVPEICLYRERSSWSLYEYSVTSTQAHQKTVKWRKRLFCN